MILDGWVVDALKNAGWLSADHVGSMNLDGSQNLLRQLNPNVLDPSIASSVRQLSEQGFRLRCSNERESQYLGQRLIWQSPKPRFTNVVSILSSRLGRKLDQRDEWFLALRAAITGSPARQTLFAVSSATAAARFVRHTADLFGREILVVEPSKDEESIELWLGRIIQSCQEPSPRPFFSISPPLHQIEPSLHVDLKHVPIQDRSLVAAADKILIIHATPTGNIASLSNFVLNRSNFDEKVQIAVHPQLLSEPHSKDLMGRGAVGWYLFHDESCSPKKESPNETVAPITALPVKDWSYLTHWTRHQQGTWIDQAENEFLDELILGASSKDRSALASLARILAARRILSNYGSNRSNTRTVSFTQVPLNAWARHRTYRRHRLRWDFEPYGICIDRAWLIERSARPVIYGSSQERDKLPDEEKPFFQINRSTNSTQTIDWGLEKEWRTIGDVDLAQLPRDAAFVFVPTEREANHIAALSNWPVAVLRIWERADG